jgi:uncharacterized protein (DUF924 family)
MIFYIFFKKMPITSVDRVVTTDTINDNKFVTNVVYTCNKEQWNNDIISKFGRFPHRNKILGRVSTLEEIVFLSTPNSSF